MKIDVYDVLKFEEGYVSVVYLCGSRHPTIGFGFNLSNDVFDDKENAVFKMLYGDIRINGKIADQLLCSVVSQYRGQLQTATFYAISNIDTKFILLSMCYQLGINGLLGFRNMIAALEAGDKETAKKEALDSLWAKQTSARAMRHARVIGGESIATVYKDLI